MLFIYSERDSADSLSTFSPLINLDSPFKLSTFALTNAGSNVCNDVSFSVNNLTTSSCGRFLLSLIFNIQIVIIGNDCYTFFKFCSQQCKMFEYCTTDRDKFYSFCKRMTLVLFHKMIQYYHSSVGPSTKIALSQSATRNVG